MIQKLVNHLPSVITHRMKGTFIERYYQRYKIETASKEEAEFDIPCGKFEFKVLEGGNYTSPDTWPAQASYPEPVIVDEFCDILNPGEVFYNIGAGFGYYSKVATVAGIPDDSIYCFESDRRSSSILQENTPDNSHNITKFVGENEDNENNIISIDEFVQSNTAPGIVKMDIQGNELSAVRGMKKTLQEYKPKLYVELHPELIPNGNVDDIFKLLTHMEYDIKTVNHRSKSASWSAPTENDLRNKSENGTDYFLRATPS